MTRNARKEWAAAAAPHAEAGVEVEAQAEVSAQEVWSVLADPWTWSHWVRGTRRIRGADVDWPQPGSRLYPRFGPLPIHFRSQTTVLACDPPTRLVVDASAWPWGRVRAELRVTAVDDATVISLREDPISGLVAALPRIGRAIQAHRNRRSLARLIECAS